MRTVRDATFDVLRHYGLTTVFANPGSTEVSFLTRLPGDLDFVLALHEASVVGVATGWAIGHDAPALVNLHTTAGLGNAVGALATARSNRVPLVVLVGQQDRRHLAFQPFLAGELMGLAGSYPVWADLPVRAQDVPGAIARAWHEARHGRGPALVVVPSDDWAEPAADSEVPAPRRLETAVTADPAGLAEIAAALDGARSAALVVGSDAGDAASWAAVVRLAERLGVPVWQEAFTALAAFPQDHPQFAGHLPAGRSRLRQTLAGHDVVLAVGAPVFRQYPYEEGPLTEPGTTLLMITDDPPDAHHSPVELAVIAPLAAACDALSQQVQPGGQGEPARRPGTGSAPSADPAGSSLSAAAVLAELGRRLPAEAIVVEETPSSRPDLQRLVPARAPLGFVSAAMGGLGFALPAAIGLRMACPDRPVVAVVGDGSSLYAIQSLWTAAHYGCGVLFVVLANGRYAIMDRLAEGLDAGPAPWPPFEEVSISALAGGLGCPAQRVDQYDDLTRILDRLIPDLAVRTGPLVLEVAVRPGDTFEP